MRVGATLVVRARKCRLCMGIWAYRESRIAVRRGTSRVKSLTRTSRPLVTADGTGIVSHAGAALLRELADESGLTHGWTAALLGTYKGTPVYLPGRVLTDLAVTLDDGGHCLADLAALRDQAALFGPFASHPTAYRVLDRVGAVELSALRAARADARARVWAAGGGPDLTDRAGLIMDVVLTEYQRVNVDVRTSLAAQEQIQGPTTGHLPRGV